MIRTAAFAVSSVIDRNWSVSEMCWTRITAASASAPAIQVTRRRVFGSTSAAGRDQGGNDDSGLGDAVDYRESRVHSLRIIRVASADVASDDAKPRAPMRATTPSGTR